MVIDAHCFRVKFSMCTTAGCWCPLFGFLELQSRLLHILNGCLCIYCANLSFLCRCIVEKQKWELKGMTWTRHGISSVLHFSLLEMIWQIWWLFIYFFTIATWCLTLRSQLVLGYNIQIDLCRWSVIWTVVLFLFFLLGIHWYWNVAAIFQNVLMLVLVKNFTNHILC